MTENIVNTNFVHCKVRNIYNVDKNRLLLQTSDRISAFNQILPQLCSGKGIILNTISCGWFQNFAASGILDQCNLRSHFISSNINDFPSNFQKKEFANSTMLVHKTKPLAIECIIRKYLMPSFYPLYLKYHKDFSLHANLKVFDAFPAPIVTFTSKTKNDRFMSWQETESFVGHERFKHIIDVCLKLFGHATQQLLTANLLLVDTKFEFGICNKKLYLIDEVFTPDSSRFALLTEKKIPTHLRDVKRNYDKQYLRDYLKSQNLDHQVPHIPKTILQEFKQRYEVIQDRSIQVFKSNCE